MGTLFTSNSNGTYFTKNIEHTNRGARGYVDFEKITGIQGIVLVNVVENWEDVEKRGAEKHIISQISFDDGRTFQDLKADGKRLQLHSVTDPNNAGKVFSSPAPGIVMGVGNTGTRVEDYKKGDLYVSDDAGLTWKKALDGSHKYEFGDQGAVIVAIEDGDATKHIQYSLNHGKDWAKADLGDKVIPRLLTTVPNSCSKRQREMIGWSS
jgi:Sortilin, neurotensin receptor 3,